MELRANLLAHQLAPRNELIRFMFEVIVHNRRFLKDLDGGELYRTSVDFIGDTHHPPLLPSPLTDLSRLNQPPLMGFPF